MAWDGKSAAVAAFVAGLIAFPLGMLYNHYENYVEPWDDGLIRVECVRGTGKPNVELTAQGFGVFDDSDDHAYNPPYVDINMPFDPKLGKMPPGQSTHIDRHRFPLGCFVGGIQQKDIVRRSWR